MSTDKEIYFLWTDLETTGLDPKKDRILELAWVISDAELNLVREPQDHVIAQEDWLDFFHYWREDVSTVVRHMHEDNGLFEALQRDDASNLDRAYLALRQDLESLPKNAEVHLAGRSVHFDRDFLIEHDFGTLFTGTGIDQNDPLISHRIFDVRSLRTFLEVMGGLPIPLTEIPTDHRALKDVYGDVAYARSARALLREAFPHPPIMVTEHTADAPYLIG